MQNPDVAPSGSMQLLDGGAARTSDKNEALSVNDFRSLLMGLCLKPQTSDTLQSLRALVAEQTTWDPTFVLCVAEDGSTPLHFACKGNNHDIARFLVCETVIRVDARDSHDRLAIHYAIERYNLPLVELLMKHMPQRAVTHGRYGSNGETLLHAAVRVDAATHAPLVERLVILGADPLLAAEPVADKVHSVASSCETPYELAKRLGMCSALFMNNYVLNRTVAEDLVELRPQDIDDEEVRVRRKEGQIVANDGYSGAERRLVRHNESWWTEGIEAVHRLASFVML